MPCPYEKDGIFAVRVTTLAANAQKRVPT